MLDKTAISIFGGSWESVVSREEYETDYTSSPRGSLVPSSRGSPLKDTSNIQEDTYLISRHNPNKTFRRETVIASWKNLKKEREQALGKKTVFVQKDEYVDYYGRDVATVNRNKVKRCTSDRTSNTPRVQKKVKRTYSVLYRYDPNEAKVVKEYKYQLPKEQTPLENFEHQHQPLTLQRSYSEPFLRERQERTQKKKVKRSFTTLLNIKTKFLNIFGSKS